MGARSVLSGVDHLVVVMLENRSFDQMLGHLSLPADQGGAGRGEVDGVQAGESCEVDGVTYRPEPMCSTAISKESDPAHDRASVDQQVAGGMEGFVRNFLETRATPGSADASVVVGYCTDQQVPVYSFLAENFCVCDRWFCSVPGGTWPNRMYAMTGGSDGERDNRSPPIYNRAAFVQQLEENGVSFRWYAHDPATLRAASKRYRLGPDECFAPFEKPSFLEPRTFFRDVATGSLPQLSWIDPNFVDLGGGAGANDDHPPADILAGQELVLKVYTALSRDAVWEKTMLLVVYDEHGGFYDHCTPPEARDEHPDCRLLGPRVPAIIASPRVEPRSVCSEVFDHTSIIRTAFELFCPDQAGQLAERMGERTKAARSLALLPAADEPRPATEIGPEVSRPILEWHMKRIESLLHNPAIALGLSEPAAGAGLERVTTWLRKKVLEPVWRATGRRRVFGFKRHGVPVRESTELSEEVLGIARYVRARGLPPGKV